MSTALGDRRVFVTTVWRFVPILTGLCVLFGCPKKHRPEPMTEVWLGEHHAFGRLKKGGLASWGSGTTGALGTGSLSSRPLPALAFADALPGALALGARHTCGLYPEGSVRCWGDGGAGQLGDGNGSPHAVASPDGATQVQDPNGSPLRAARIWARGDKTCATTKDEQRAFCWGAGHAKPFELGALRGARVVDIAFDDAGLCAALEAPREVRCTQAWTDAASSDAVTTLLRNEEISALTGGSAHHCALGPGSSLRCWGTNARGQLGDGSFRDSEAPAPVAAIDEVVEIAAGREFTCARTLRSAVLCWGDNASFQIVDGTTEPRALPSVVPGLVAVVQIVAAGDSACARLVDGGVRCWGKNADGQLGDGSLKDHRVPMPVQW